MANKQMKTLTQGGVTYDIKDATALPLDGSEIMTGTLIMKKVDNGQGEWYKNHNETKDLGTVIVDKDANGNSARIGASALAQTIYAALSSHNGNNMFELFGEHNTALLNEEIKHNIKTYSSLTQLGLTGGSETIASIVQAMVQDSQLVYYVGSSGFNTSIYPTAFGTLLIIKKTNIRTMLFFLSTNNDLYTGHYYISNGTETWSGWERIVKNDEVSNPNLLINSDFRYPINQRGLTTYGTIDYTIDRWVSRNAYTQVSIQNKYIRVKASSGSASEGAVGINQPLDNLDRLLGKNVTLSFKVRGVSGSGKWRFGIVESTTINDTDALVPTNMTNHILVSAAGTYSLTVTLPATLNYKHLCVSVLSEFNDIYGLAEGDSIDIEWMKLEYGAIATSLPIRQSDTEELLKCQRYFYKPSTSSTSVFTGYLNSTCKQIGFGVPFPVVMRAVPTMSTPNVIVRTVTGLSPLTPGVNSPLSPDSITISNSKPEIIMLLVMQMNDGSVWADTSLGNTVCSVAVNNYLQFDAEIR